MTPRAATLARLALAVGVVMAVLAFVVALVTIWTGDERWWQTFGVFAATAFFALGAAGMAATFPG